MDDFTADELPGEYDALGDPRQVMAEVIRLLGDLHRAATRLGDAIVAAGFPAREWRSMDAWLPQLPGELPEISLDVLLTRLAEFAAATGPHWLHGATADLQRFHEEAQVLYEVIRPLRAFAQRQRMLPPRDRGSEPLWRTLGDPRVGTPLDLAASRLRDLDSLATFLSPLSPTDWQRLETSPEQPSSVQPSSVQPSSVQASARPVLDSIGAASSPPAPQAPFWPAETAPNATETARKPLRLRDFVSATAPSQSSTSEPPASRWAALKLAAKRFLAQRWAVVATAAVLLAMGTGLLTLAARGQQGPRLPRPSNLSTTPSKLSFTCTGKGTTLTLILRDTGATDETWTAQPPSDLRLFPARGTLKAGASVTIRITITHARTSHGDLTFTDQDGTLTVPYTVACSH